LVTVRPSEVRALVLAPAGHAFTPAPGAPSLSRATAELLEEIEIVDESGKVQRINIPCERPLTVWLDGRELVTLMTLGGAPEWLVLGYLANQRVVSDMTTLDSIRIDWSVASAQVKSRAPAPATDRGAAVACALGSSYGNLTASLDRIKLASLAAARITHEQVLNILATMRSHDDIHRAAGSVHSCALFRSDELFITVEDVSRHNGVDTISGWMALHAVDGADKTLFTTGRLTGEMVFKAALNGIPIAITRNGVTAMGRKLAERFGMTLIGRAANRRYLCYCGRDRLDSSS
jgi:FdhD protein